MAPSRRDEDYAIAKLERALEQAEGADSEKQKILNNLGLAHSHRGRYRAALRAHREEKRACKRLLANPDAPRALLVDLSIAYRHCGDATMHIDSLVVDNDESITERVEIMRRAHEQHSKALRTAQSATGCGVDSAAVEVQAAWAAMGQSAVNIASITRSKTDFQYVIKLSGHAAQRAEELTNEEAGGRRQRVSMTLSAAVNLAIGMSGMGDKKRSRTLFEAIAVRAKHSGDIPNQMRGLANLGEEASEDEDWELCLEYTDEWIALAKELKDEGEEGEGLRKRSTALFQMQRYEDARVALDRAAVIGRDEYAREDARRLLEVLESHLEDIRDAEETLVRSKQEAELALEAGESVKEARAQLTAGEACYRLKNNDGALEHFSRYFALVDDYGCSLSATGVDLKAHTNAVTHLAETFWEKKCFSEAVEWATRELAVCGDDLAGQAQAWCNLGIYLDDDGKLERAKEALHKSIALAEEAGDIPLRQKAEENLQIVIENNAERTQKALAEAHAQGNQNSVEDMDVATDLNTDGIVEDSSAPRHNRTGNKGAPVRLHSSGPLHRNAAAEHVQVGHSVVIDSGTVRGEGYGSESAGKAAETSVHVSSCGERRTAASVSRSAADRSFAGSRFIDLVAIFRKRCAALSQGGAPVKLESRSVIEGRLRSLSTKLVTSDEGDAVSVDFSTTFICDDEFPPLLQTLASLPVQEPLMFFNFQLNPMLSTASVRWLASSSKFNGLPRALPSLITLDLSGTGIDSNCLPMLARALSTGNLPNVTTLSLGKNKFGQAVVAAVEGVARLLVQKSNLESLDLSLNLFPFLFLIRLVELVERMSFECLPMASKIAKIDLRLNNRRAPTALLESVSASAPADHIRRLLSALPSLRLIDVRACGAAAPARRELFKLRAELRDNADGTEMGMFDTRDLVEVVVTSPQIYDPEEDAAMGCDP